MNCYLAYMNHSLFNFSSTEKKSVRLILLCCCSVVLFEVCKLFTCKFYFSVVNEGIRGDLVLFILLSDTLVFTFSIIFRSSNSVGATSDNTQAIF